MCASVDLFSAKAGQFLKATDEYVRQGVNPGGYYRAVWARDAAYILKDWFLAGRIEDVLQEILFIWSHQIARGREKIVYGRGSPEMSYMSQIAAPETEARFEGALPTTIFRGFSEVYGQNPDIDSTALMISTTSWILDIYMKAGLVEASTAAPHLHTQPVELKISSTVANPSVITDFVVPRMLKAVDYLAGRDIDGDGLLEQGHNEDWMDTVLRAGKIVYSQACWILALSNLSSLLSQLGSKDAGRVMDMAHRAIDAVEQKLWIEEEGTYADMQEEHHVGAPYRTLTQDVSLYLIATTENTTSDILGTLLKKQKHPEPDFSSRAGRTLDAMKGRIWKNKWPLVTEAELKKTGPWKLHPNQYHNHTFWPWTTGIEMLARSRHGRVDECDWLLSIMTRGEPEMLAFYEWANPITGKGDGAYPFRTGISSVRIAISDILARQ